MQLSQSPIKFLVPFANSATASYIRDIPQGSQVGIVNGAASLETGFPPLNFLPVGSGGVPPFGQDMNGILRQITQWSRWQATGALNLWDSAFATAIGGYPRGSLLSSTTSGVAWLSTADNNLTNPDGGTAAGWQPVLTGASVPQTSLVHAGTDTSTTQSLISIPALVPPVSALANYQVFEIVPATSISGATNVSIQNFGSVPLKRNNGSDVRDGDGPAGQPFLAVFLNGVLRRLGLTQSEIAGLVTTGPTITNYLTTQGYAPPGAGFAGSQQRFGYSPTQNVPSALSATFTAPYSGVVQCVATLNSSPQNGNISNAANINVAGQNFSGAADTVQGSSVSTSFAKVLAGQAVVVSSTVTPADPTPFSVSQYLNFAYNP